MAEPNNTGSGWDLTHKDVCDIAVASGWIEDTPEARAAYLAETRGTAMTGVQQEPYWRTERYLDGAGQWHDRWQPSREMTYLLGCLLSTQHDIEGVTMQRPTLVLLPADKTPSDSPASGMLMGLPFVVSDKVTEISLVYPVRARARVQLMEDGTPAVPANSLPLVIQDEVNRLDGQVWPA